MTLPNVLLPKLERYAFAADLLKDPHYNTIALAEEVGKCLGKYKKHLRDGLVIHKPPQGLGVDYHTPSPLAVELGDVLFYWAYLVHSHGQETAHYTVRQPGSLTGTPITHLSSMYYHAAHLLIDIHLHEPVAEFRLAQLYDHWLLAVESIGYSAEEVFGILIHKISSRQTRGTQSGSGDSR